MSDTREQILIRLQSLLGEIYDAPAENVFRDRGDVPTTVRPCMILLDAGETLASSNTTRTGRSMGPAPQIMRMDPQIFALLKSRPVNESDQLGIELSQYRVAMMQAILFDTQLQELVGENGQIQYRGCDTDMQTGGSMEGELQMHFSLYYALDPSKL